MSLPNKRLRATVRSVDNESISFRTLDSASARSSRLSITDFRELYDIKGQSRSMIETKEVDVRRKAYRKAEVSRVTPVEHIFIAEA